MKELWTRLWKFHAGILRHISHYRWFGPLAWYVVTPLDRVLIRVSRGRLSMTGPEFTTMLLTTTGGKTGRERTIPVMYVRDGTKVIAVSMNVGRQTPASWPKNLLANPRARIEITGKSADYRSRLATADEEVRYLRMLTDMWPAMDTYFERTGVRYLFVFEPEVERQVR